MPWRIGSSVASKLLDQRLELLFALRHVLGPGLERRSHLRDHGHVISDHLLLLLDFVETRLDASR
jgi:hypothetical protein